MKNKLINITIACGLIISCNSPKKGYKENSFYTEDSLYKITIELPIELDTFYTWTDVDDNACSDETKYRFSKTDFQHEKESGFIWNSYVDSTYRLTIKHVEHFACKHEMDNEQWVSPKEQKDRLIEISSRKQTDIKIDTVINKEINGNNFLISQYSIKNRSEKRWTEYLKGTTLIDSNMVVLEFDCRTNNCDGFIEKMEESLNSVKIKSTATNSTLPPLRVSERIDSSEH